MNSAKHLLFLSFFIPLLACCQPAKNNLKSLNAVEFQSSITSDSVLLVDVRSAREFNLGHIKGALNVDVNNPGFASIVESNHNKTKIALYCRSGSRSKLAASKLSDSKLVIIELNHGFIGWLQSGLPI